MHDIFVSYSHEDADRVETLVESLKLEGWDVWWDVNIRTGARYSDELDQQINDAGCVVVCWSQASVNSDWVKSEASRGRRKLVPVSIDDIDIPETFREFQTIDLSKWPDDQSTKDRFRKLCRDIRAQLQLSADTKEITRRTKSEPATIAVLPFENLTRADSDEYLADGIAQDLIMRLERFQTFPVIARSSSFAYKNRNVHPSVVAAELGADYLVDGSVQRHGDSILVRVYLVDTLYWSTLWSQAYERDMTSPLTVLDEVSLLIAGTIQPGVAQIEREKALAEPENTDLWHIVRKATWHLYRLTREDSDKAHEYLEQALEQDSKCVEALVQMSWWHFWRVSSQRGQREDWDEMEKFAQGARLADSRDYRPPQLLGVVEMMRGNHREAEQLYRESIDLNPSNAVAWSNLGSVYILSGAPELAVDSIEKALKLSPFDYHVFHALGELSHAHYFLGNWDEAVSAADRSIHLRPRYWLANAIKAASLARSGRMEEAERALSLLLKRRPEFGWHDLDWLMYSDRALCEQLATDLKLAGWKTD